MAARVQAAVRFEREHSATIRDFDFRAGDLILVRNTAIEKSLNRKMRARYLGPLVVVSRNKGGAYIICELNGSVFDRPVAAFRVIPYFARTKIAIPDLSDFLDISTERLRDMERAQSNGDDDDDERDVEPEAELEDELDLTASDLEADAND